MSAIEFEIESEGIELHAGALAPLADTRRCECGRVSLGDDTAHREDGCRPIVRAEVVQVAYPVPKVTSREPWDGSGTPGPVLKLAQRAREASWSVRVQRSRGNLPHATHGRPGALKTRYALVLGNGQWSAYAVHDGTTWISVMLWGRFRPWFPLASVTDLNQYVSAHGEMDDRWYEQIRERVRAMEARLKEQAKMRVKRGAGEAL